MCLLGTFSATKQYPKCKNSQSTRLLTTSTYTQRNGIADPRADWATISDRPGNNTERGSVRSLQLNALALEKVSN